MLSKSRSIAIFSPIFMKNLLQYALFLLFTIICWLTCYIIGLFPIAHHTGSIATNTQALPQSGQQWLLKTNEISICAVPIPIGDHLFYHDLQIYLAKQTLLFSDTNSIFTTDKETLPIVRKMENGHYEVLLGMVEPYQQGRILQLLANKNTVYYKDTLPMLSPMRTKTPQDEFAQFGGFWFEPDLYCQLCDSAFYNPFLIYEMKPNGLELDTLATRQWILEHYTDFYGYKPSTPIVVVQRKSNVEIDT